MILDVSVKSFPKELVSTGLTWLSELIPTSDNRFYRHTFSILSFKNYTL